MSLPYHLNRFSNYFLDWYRVGELARSNHTYSINEILIRLLILAWTISPVVYHQTLTFWIGCECVVIFSVVHLIVIFPLILKRYRIKQDCDRIINDLRTRCTCSHLKCKLCQDISRIMSMDADRASVTWGQRKRALLGL